MISSISPRWLRRFVLVASTPLWLPLTLFIHTLCVWCELLGCLPEEFMEVWNK